MAQIYEPTKDTFNFFINTFFPFLIISFILEVQSKMLCFIDDLVFFFSPWFSYVFTRIFLVEGFKIAENFRKYDFFDPKHFIVAEISLIIFCPISISILWFDYKIFKRINSNSTEQTNENITFPNVKFTRFLIFGLLV